MSVIFTFVMFAAKRHSSGDMPPGIAIFLVAVSVIALIVAIAYQMIQNEKRKRQQAERDKWNNRQYLAWHARVQQFGRIHPVPCDLMLKRGEECLYVAHNVTLYEVRAVRHSTHSFGSVPLGKTGIRIGQGASTSRSTDEWTPIASGELYVTTKQLFFDGDMQDRKIPLAKIATIKADYSAIEVSSETRQKSMIFMDCNGQIVRDAVQLALQT